MAGTNGGAAPTRILVPLDGSRRAEAILPTVERLARACGAKLTLLRVKPPVETFAVPAEPAMAFATHGTIAPPEDVRNAQYEAEHYLDAIVDRLGIHDVVAETKVAEGQPGEAIVGAAEVEGAGMIAMTTHGRGNIGRLVMGSVADYVMRNAECPVLLVRAA